MSTQSYGPSGYRPNWIHLAIVFAGMLSDIPPALISPALAGLAAIAAWPWRQPALQWTAGSVVAALIVVDWVALALLPRRGRSFGPVTPPLLALALLRVASMVVLGALWPTWTVLIVALVLQLAISVVQVYATWIEPFRIQVTQVEIASPKLGASHPLRLLHVSDIHFEGWTPRERRLLALAQELAPDLIVITGDYLSLSSVHDPAAHAGVRELLESLCALAPTYAITGSPPVDLPQVVPAIFAGLPITWLLDETLVIEWAGHRLRLVGVRCRKDRRGDGARLRQVVAAGWGDDFVVLLYHSPDLMPDAAALGVDLYLAGHTHGGQIRLPLWGALLTSSDFWKRYEAGQYREGATTLYVSRGLGMEGLGAPRARFLSSPELVLFRLYGRT